MNGKMTNGRMMLGGVVFGVAAVLLFEILVLQNAVEPFTQKDETCLANGAPPEPPLCCTNIYKTGQKTKEAQRYNNTDSDIPPALQNAYNKRTGDGTTVPPSPPPDSNISQYEVCTSTKYG